MAYTVISPLNMAVDKPITSAIGLALYNNPIEIAAGGAGAPKVMAAALNTSVNTLTGSLSSGSSATVTLSAYSFFPAVSGGGTFDVSYNGGTADAPRLSIANITGSTNSYTVTWRAIS